MRNIGTHGRWTFASFLVLAVTVYAQLPKKSCVGRDRLPSPVHGAFAKYLGPPLTAGFLAETSGI
ncbi:MAG: hypothetical protein K2X38_16670 [Gemmataceae bacterium]|nr:hypothetical protein [Gemmataceae bacterium]